MSGLDEMKQTWKAQTSLEGHTRTYDVYSLQDIVKKRARKQMNAAMQYFWAAFVLQNIVYALLANVIIRYRDQAEVVLLAVAGIILYIPFTTMLIIKFRKMATVRPVSAAPGSLKDYIAEQFRLLNSFFRFKKFYELFLIPVSSAIGVIIVFNLYVPGGLVQHLAGALITFALTLLSCTVAIMNENKRNFQEPIQQLKQMLAEFDR